MEFLVDGDTRIINHQGSVAFSKLTLGLLIRVDYTQNTEGTLTATEIRMLPQDEIDSAGEAISL